MNYYKKLANIYNAMTQMSGDDLPFKKDEFIHLYMEKCETIRMVNKLKNILKNKLPFAYSVYKKIKKNEKDNN